MEDKVALDRSERAGPRAVRVGEGVRTDGQVVDRDGGDRAAVLGGCLVVAREEVVEMETAVGVPQDVDVELATPEPIENHARSPE